MFGAKYVDLIYPSDPQGTLRGGQVIQSRNVTVEANTVFQNVVAIIDRVDVAKLNSTLSALADGVRGLGPQIGEAHHRRESSSPATQSAQRHHRRGLAHAAAVQRHLQRCRG